MTNAQLNIELNIDVVSERPASEPCGNVCYITSRRFYREPLFVSRCTSSCEGKIIQTVDIYYAFVFVFHQYAVIQLSYAGPSSCTKNNAKHFGSREYLKRSVTQWPLHVFATRCLIGYYIGLLVQAS